MHTHPPNRTQERKRITYRGNAHERCNTGCTHCSAHVHCLWVESSAYKRPLYRFPHRDVGRWHLPAFRPLHEGQLAGRLTILNHPLVLAGILLLITAVTGFEPGLVGRANYVWNMLSEKVRFGNRVFGCFAFMQPGKKEADMDLRPYGI